MSHKSAFQGNVTHNRTEKVVYHMLGKFHEMVQLMQYWDLKKDCKESEWFPSFFP